MRVHWIFSNSLANLLNCWFLRKTWNALWASSPTISLFGYYNIISISLISRSNKLSLRMLTCKRVINYQIFFKKFPQARNQDFMWGGANEAKVDQTTEIIFYFLKKLWCCVGGGDQNKSLVLSNELINVELPPWKIQKADVSSVSPSSERRAQHLSTRLIKPNY